MHAIKVVRITSLASDRVIIEFKVLTYYFDVVFFSLTTSSEFKTLYRSNGRRSKIETR